MLSVSNLSVSYGANTVLHNLSIEVQAGEIVCILGRNGAGKSTLMNTISGLLRQDCGQILFNDINPGKYFCSRAISSWYYSVPRREAVVPKLIGGGKHQDRS